MTVTAPRLRAAPYRGLAPFGDGELDAMTFFGRERDTEIVVANLLASRLTVLYGPSGVGKTSLLRAGAARRIRELSARRAIGRGPDGAVIVFSSWSGAAVPALAAAVGDEVRSLVGHAVGAPPRAATLADALEHWSAALDGELFLVLDQLEEHFVYHRGERGPGTLVGELPEVVVRPHLRAHVLLSLREDTLAQLDVLQGAVPGLFANVVRLDRLSRAAARAAIVGPLQALGELSAPEDRVTVEPRLVEAVLEQTAADETGRIEAPYLQLVMERVWDEETGRASRVLRVSTLDELGGASRIVHDHLGAALAGLGEQEQEMTARMFEHLVTPSGTKIAHRAVDLAQLAKAPQDRTDALLERLGRSRIVRSVDDVSGADTRYEIFHDVLAGAIVAWSRTRELEHERRQARRHRRRLIAVVATSLAALLVMAAVTIFALTQRSDARSQATSARAQAFAAAALNDLSRDPELSLLLARRATGLRTSPQLEDVLRESLLASRVRHAAVLGSPITGATFARSGDAVAVTAAGRVAVVRPSGTIRRGFSLGPGRALLDPTGTHVLSYGTGRAARLVAVPTAASVRLRSRPVTDGVFTPDGRLLVTASRSRLVGVWDTASGRRLRLLTAEGEPAAVAVSADGALVAAAVGHVTQLFSLDGARAVSTVRTPGTAERLAFSPDGETVAIAAADHTVTIADTRTGGTRARLAGHVLTITDVVFSPDGQLVATSSADGTARVYGRDGALVAVLVGHGLPVTSIVFSSDGTRVATTSGDGTARIWRAVNGNQVAVLAGHGGAVADVVFSPAGHRVATAGADGTLRLWYADAEPTLTAIERRAQPVAAALPVGGGVVVAPPDARDVAVSPDGTRVATLVGRRVEVRARTSGRRVGAFTVTGEPTGIALAPEASLVAVAGDDGVVELRRPDGSTVRRLEASAHALTRVAFSADGRLVAAGSTDHDAYVWPVDGGTPRTYRGHTDTVNSARFDTSGRLLVTAGRDHQVLIWDVAARRAIRVLRGHFGSVADAAFSPDGRFVVTAGPGKAGLFDARTGELVFYLAGHAGPLTSASFAADGRTIVTAGSDGTVRSYRCDLCGTQADLERLADRRVAATGRRLTASELQVLGL